MIRRFVNTFKFIFKSLPFLFPFIIALLITPSLIYLSNQTYYHFNINVLVPFWGIFCLASIIMLWFYYKVSFKIRKIVLPLFFFSGLYLLISEAFTPISVGKIVDMTELTDIKEPVLYTCIDIVLLITAIIAGIKLPHKKLRNVYSLFILIILLLNTYSFIKSLHPNTHIVRTVKLQPRHKSPIKKHNIYQIAFDGYSQDYFLEIAKRNKIENEFDGFIFYEKNLSNDRWTGGSLASYMSGTFYSADMRRKFDEWRFDWCEKEKPSLLTDAYNFGYNINQYVSQLWHHFRASSYITIETIAKKYYYGKLVAEMIDYIFLRLAPNFFQQEFFYKGIGLTSRIYFSVTNVNPYQAESYYSVKIMEKLISDEAKRANQGEYVYAHIWIPHGPNVMDCNCQYNPPQSKAVDLRTLDRYYASETECATKLIHKFISQLKQTGNYHDSFIIIHSDHGRNHKNDALLMIKPPDKSGNPMVISDLQTQLLDIPATIYSILDIDKTIENAHSVLSKDFPQKRDIHMFDCYANELEVVHYLRTWDGKKKSLPPIKK